MGDSRETVARVLPRWRTRGIVTTARRSIIVHDQPTLRAIASGIDAL